MLWSRLALLALVTCMCLAVGCGAGSGGDPGGGTQTPGVVTATVTAAGCTLTSPTDGQATALTVPPGGAPVGTRLSMRVLESSSVSVPNPSAFLVGHPVELTVGAAGAASRADAGLIALEVPLPVDAPQDAELLVATHGSEGWRAFPAATPAPTPIAVPGAAGGSVTIAPIAVTVPTGSPEPEPLPFPTQTPAATAPALSWYVWDPNITEWEACAAPAEDHGMAVAVLVHGLLGSREDMRGLASWLHRSGAYTVYAVEWGYGNNVEASGAALASALQAIRLTATGSAYADAFPHIDVFAHSMGSIMARAAVELYGASTVVHDLVTLGGPHDGIQWDLVFWEPRLAALVPGPQLLGKLNGSALPVDQRLTRYFTAAGTSHEGHWMHAILSYLALAAPSLDPDLVLEGTDGLVPVRSASMDLSHEAREFDTQPFALNHTQLHDHLAVYETITSWLELPDGAPQHVLSRDPRTEMEYVPWRWAGGFTGDGGSAVLQPTRVFFGADGVLIMGPARMTSDGSSGWRWTTMEGPSGMVPFSGLCTGDSGTEQQEWTGEVTLNASETTLEFSLDRVSGTSGPTQIRRTMSIKSYPANPDG